MAYCQGFLQDTSTRCLVRWTAVGWLVLALVGSGWILAHAELAENADRELELPPVVVHGERPEEQSVAITHDLSRNPSSTVLVPADDIQQSRGYNLEDVFRLAPGVFFQSRGGATDGKLNIRGTNLSSNLNTWGVTLLVNGLPFNAADGFAQLETIDLLAVDHIEVYKGAQALKFGANSLGGAVNFVLKTGTNQPTVRVSGEGGSFGMYNSQLASGYATGPFNLLGETAKADSYVSVTGSGQDGYREHSQQQAVRFNANFGITVGTRHQARATIISANVNSQLPGPLTLQEFEANPRQAGAWEDVGGNLLVCGQALPCRYTNNSLLNRIGFVYQYRDETGGMLTVSPFYQYWKWNSNFTQILDHLTQDTGAAARYSQSNILFGWSHRWVIGASPSYGVNRLNLFKNDFGNLGSILQNRYIQTLSLGAYIEDEIQVLPKVAIILGGRLDYSSRHATVTDFSPPGILAGARTGERVFSAFNPKAGFVVRTSDTSQLYGNVSRGYEAPINIQLMQPLNAQSIVPNGAFLDVDAQRAWQFEFGHRGTARHGDIAWDIAAYDLEMRKEILVTALQLPGIGEVATYRNAGASRHLGVETGGSLVLAKGLVASGSDRMQDRLTIRAAYTWRRYRFLEDALKVSNGVAVADAQNGHAIPGIPTHWVTGELKYTYPLGWWIAPNIEWSPAGYFVDFDNRLKNPPFAIINLKMGYTHHNLTMFFEGRNLTDQNYSGSVAAGGVNGANAGTSRLFLPSWPLSFFGGVSYQWS